MQRSEKIKDQIIGVLMEVLPPKPIDLKIRKFMRVEDVTEVFESCSLKFQMDESNMSIILLSQRLFQLVHWVKNDEN